MEWGQNLIILLVHKTVQYSFCGFGTGWSWCWVEWCWLVIGLDGRRKESQFLDSQGLSSPLSWSGGTSVRSSSSCRVDGTWFTADSSRFCSLPCWLLQVNAGLDRWWKYQWRYFQGWFSVKVFNLLRWSNPGSSFQFEWKNKRWFNLILIYFIINNAFYKDEHITHSYECYSNKQWIKNM